MTEQFNTRKHTYGLKGVLQTFPAYLGVLCMLGILLMIVKHVQDIQSFCAFLLGAAIFGSFFIGFLAVMVMFPSVKVLESGVEIQVFWFWWILVPWGNVLDFYHWPMGFKRVVIVEVERLTPFHLVYGLMYAHKTKSAFLIRTSITGYDELIRTMESQTGKQLDS
jgi:hypothetical protein